MYLFSMCVKNVLMLQAGLEWKQQSKEYNPGNNNFQTKKKYTSEKTYAFNPNPHGLSVPPCLKNNLNL